MQQRITVVRLFYDFLVEDQRWHLEPGGRGRYTPGRGFAGTRERGSFTVYEAPLDSGRPGLGHAP